MNFDSKIFYFSELPSIKTIEESLKCADSNLANEPTYFLIYDKNIKAIHPEWLNQFDRKYEVEAGEDLKNLEKFPDHVIKITNILESISHKNLRVVALGGGTIGDFAGFFASTYKRGVGLIHMPTTWLAALDSAHGGKNALNVGGIKNQLGTFYPAQSVVLVEEVFETLNHEQLISGLGELIKIGLVNSPGVLEPLRGTSKVNSSVLWSLLPQAIEGKMQIVRRDPYEQTGERQKLNLGHTLGHAIETKFQVPHGLAVLQGLVFAARWSEFRGYISSSVAQEILSLIQKFYSPSPCKFESAELLHLLFHDKKRSESEKLNFVFIDSAEGARIQSVSVAEILQEAQRQGWL